MNLKPYRKAVIATVAAVVTILATFDVSVAENVPDQVIAVFDALTAILVYAVPNSSAE